MIEVVLDKLAYGWSPEEIHFQHPGLSLAKIHAALTYYYEHQPLLDAEIARRAAESDTLAQHTSGTEFRNRLSNVKRAA